MSAFKISIILVLSLIGGLLFSGVALAEGVVISQVQIGDVNSSRLVEIYNNTDNPIDITKWCLYRSSASDLTKNTLVCMNGENPNEHWILPGRAYFLTSSSQTNLSATDFLMTSTMGSVSGGHVYLIDDAGLEVDRLGWGVAVKPEMKPIAVNKDATVLERKQETPDKYVDTNDNSADFFNSVLRDKYTVGAITKIIDVCPNLDGLQTEVPVGYEIDEVGSCTEPLIDVCPNIDDVQEILPDGYILDSTGNCFLKPLPLQLNELLPNAVGTDADNEFIEIYNPNDAAVELDDYQLQIGPSFEKAYDFPSDSVIGANEYLAFYNSEIGFTLVNTNSGVRLVDFTGAILDEVTYSEPSEGDSWALINDVWQYTNQSTPNESNLASVLGVATEIDSTDEPAPCPEGQYRNPLTNRCKKIEVETLIPCANGYYRDPTTSRCRKTVTSSSDLAACPVGKYRNPLTNRCKSIESTSDELQPCPSGQERNPDTNRCRKVSGATIPAAGYAPEETKNVGNNMILWLSLGGVGLAAIGYGVWEWRREIVELFENLKALIRRRK